jgi:alkanesulfonate monooxygenase SsuD/methylene tetrahydromethanopterin reductase-like flavin-dependent oxidoreductase (luciferase family)
VLDFSIFDHLDTNGAPLGSFLDERLRLIEVMEQADFNAYHLAEHHSSPLGMASSPSVFLASAIQRTSKIKLGPLVYVLPLYHPLRVYEEVCMLDHLSKGRFMLGVGRGGALVEHQRYGIDPTNASALYQEAFAVLMKAFDSDVLDFEGKFFTFKDFVIQAKPYQLPHPPIWYGAPSPDAIAWAVPKAINVVSLGPAVRAKAISDRYRKDWSDLGRSEADLPRIGITRHIVVADTDAEAQRIAKAAYPRWRAAMEYLWKRSGQDFSLKEIYPLAFEDLQAIGHGIAGSPATVRDYIARLEREAGINYVLCQMVFGDMNFSDASHSIKLFGKEVMREFR